MDGRGDEDVIAAILGSGTIQGVTMLTPGMLSAVAAR